MERFINVHPYKEAMQTEIEMSCHANECRSKLAEAVGKRYVHEQSLRNVFITSSGVYVNAIAQRQVPFDFMIAMTEQGLKQDIYTRKDIEGIEVAIKEGNTPALGRYVQQAVNILAPLERANRDYFAQKDRLEITTDRKQTITKPITAAIICMDDITTREARHIYAAADRKISIDTVGKYINEQFAEIPMTIGLAKESFAEAYEQIRTYIPQTIDVILNNMM